MIGPYELNQIYHGDARQLARPIPDNSIDIIYTDPNYAKEFLPLYGWLAEVGARVLKPNGFLCCMAGGFYLDQVFAQFNGKGLNWYWKFELQISGEASVIWPRRIVTRTKPILTWTKGDGVIATHNVTDVYHGQGKAKRWHLYEQDVGTARYVIECILGEGVRGVLLEPFCGGGSTLEACVRLGIDFIAFDEDEEAVKSSRQRLAGLKSPMHTRQLELL